MVHVTNAQESFPFCGLFSCRSSLGPAVLETLVTVLALSAIHFASKQFLNAPSLLTKNIAPTAMVLTGSSIAIREGIESLLISETTSKHEKRSIRLIGALMGLVAGATLMNRPSRPFSCMRFENLTFKDLSLLALSQFSLIFAPSAYIRFAMEQEKKNPPLIQDQKVEETGSDEKLGSSSEDQPPPQLEPLPVQSDGSFKEGITDEGNQKTNNKTPNSKGKSKKWTNKKSLMPSFGLNTTPNSPDKKNTGSKKTVTTQNQHSQESSKRNSFSNPIKPDDPVVYDVPSNHTLVLKDLSNNPGKPSEIALSSIVGEEVAEDFYNALETN